MVLEDLNTMLVAIMYSTLLGLSLGALLMSLAGRAAMGAKAKSAPLFIAWALFLLLAHFSLFWDTKALTEIVDWTFGWFLFVVAGPILLLFATQVFVAGLEEVEEHAVDAWFSGAARRFLRVFVAVNLWVAAAAWLIGGKIGPEVIVSMALAAIALAASFTDDRRYLGAACAASWVCFFVY